MRAVAYTLSFIKRWNWTKLLPKNMDLIWSIQNCYQVPFYITRDFFIFKLSLDKAKMISLNFNFKTVGKFKNKVSKLC